ncbi:uncharacterized protein BO66DRAFT_318737 [Aspergillus aculeatinus CBS 121060]|uniref:Uncharacterized protein n=1 Tax=Aspergillus aculeatinus CBS 121060 TaxID=1448322 RepID=A0ACD1HEM3_9EURO|nr:hypothetical protein BO66DRAFT_318737 [Aspergillus aculeatinus CBS 121060]RAH71860.1 hypothetical protein BO66DRAFT_318737 [Aspergillus aculeatinus CBS 121060]
MHSPEPAKHKELRSALRAIKNHVEGLEAHELDYSQLAAQRINVSPMELDEKSSARPCFFKPCPAHLLMVPDDEYDQKSRTKYQEFKSVHPIFRRPIDCARNMITYYSHFWFDCAIHSENYILDGLWRRLSLMAVPFEDLFECNEPEFGTPELVKAKRGRESPPMKAMVYNNLDGNENTLLRGEVVIALRVINGQMRRSRFFEHSTVPVLLFSFLGPQHARVIEAYFDGSSVVMRPLRLFDLREKDQTLIRTFAQWFLGEPTGETRVLRGV